jgi:hypothetical protein
LPVFLLVVKSAKLIGKAIRSVEHFACSDGRRFAVHLLEQKWRLDSYRLSSVIERIKGDREDTCVTASRGPAASGIGHQAVANRMDTADSGTHPLGGSCTARISPYIRI